MIAYHFPPAAGSSGIQRTLRFVRYLPEFGWQPVVLTAHPRAYKFVSDDQMSDIRAGVEVIRAPALDTKTHLAIGGRYPEMLAIPDRFVSWWLGAVWQGMRALKQAPFDAIWSTYPIATAHMIGATLAKRSGLPWLADFRDPMVQADFPHGAKKRKRYAEIEADALRQAVFSMFTTPSAVREYQCRYPERKSGVRLLENGYDEETFGGVRNQGPLRPGRLTVLHSGLVYPVSRDPTQLFAALARLRDSEPAIFQRLNVRFRASYNEDMLHALADRFGVEQAVETVPPMEYRAALQEMCSADGLLVLQAADCNSQIPAKLYEYLRARRPLLVMSDPVGDTAKVARLAGIQAIARLDDAEGIANQLVRFVRRPTEGTLPSNEAIASASRKERTRQLADLLNEATVVR